MIFELRRNAPLQAVVDIVVSACCLQEPELQEQSGRVLLVALIVSGGNLRRGDVVVLV